MELIESSSQAVYEKKLKVALERAKEASSREKALIKLQERAQLSESHNVDLTFLVISILINSSSNK